MSETDLIQQCLRYIRCDEPNCNHINPQHFCVKCNLVHYCSLECQKRHAKEHEADCFALEEMQARMICHENGDNNNSSNNDILRADDSNFQRVIDDNPSCGICLGELTNPIVLKRCHHAFCFVCLKQWNDYQSGSSSVVASDENGGGDNDNNETSTPKTTCPLCRQEIPQVSVSLLDSAMCRMAAARKPGISAKERKRLCDLAKADVETIHSASDPSLTTHEPYRAQVSLLLAEIAVLEEEYFRALQILQATSDWMEDAVWRGKKLVELQKRGNLILQHLGGQQHEQDSPELDEIIFQIQELSAQGMATDTTSHAKIILKIGQVQRLQKDYETAKITYQSLTKQYPNEADLTAPQQREMFMSMSECAYHLGRYDVAVGLGEAALLMNRYYPWSHKYVAMAYREQGNLVKAIQVAAEGVVYEAPWDYHHLQQVEQWYRDEFGTFNEEEVLRLARKKKLAKVLRWLSFVMVLIVILGVYIWKSNKSYAASKAKVAAVGDDKLQSIQAKHEKKIESGEL